MFSRLIPALRLNIFLRSDYILLPSMCIVHYHGSVDKKINFFSVNWLTYLLPVTCLKLLIVLSTVDLYSALIICTVNIL